MSDSTQHGLLPTGFVRMRLPEIRQAIIDDLQSRTALVFETRPDSITGQFIDTFADRETVLWELAEAVYHAMYPVSAFGVNLDHAVSFAGVRRLFERRSTVWCVLYGEQGARVPVRAVVRQASSQAGLTLDAATTITRETAIDVVLEVTPPVEGQVYSVRVGTVTFSYTAAMMDDSLAVTASLAQQLYATGLQVVTDANHIRLYAVEFTPFALTVSETINIVLLGSGGAFTAQETGPLEIAAHSVTQIVTTAPGWQAVDNRVPGHTGRNVETDDELRRRYAVGVFRLGAATLPAIRASLLEYVPGLLALEVFENHTSFVDAEGRTPHSIEVVAYGGDPQTIANEIWRLKAAGIDTFGSVRVVVADAQGYHHAILFNRPVVVYIWLRVTVHLYAEETFPTGGTAEIQRILVETGNAFGIGMDVIIQRFMGPVYDAVDGIRRLDIQVAASQIADDTPEDEDYDEGNIRIASRELAQFDLSRTAVTVPLTDRPHNLRRGRA